jgi:hypothetical protein
MPSPKVKKTVSLDIDLVEFVGDGNLSYEVNEALKVRLEGQRRNRAFGEWLDEMDAAEGPPDPADLAMFRRLLGGPDDGPVR